MSKYLNFQNLANKTLLIHRTLDLTLILIPNYIIII